MMPKIEKLLDLMIAYYERELGSDVPPSEPKTRKPRATKAEPAAAPAPVAPVDPLMDLGAAPTQPAAAPEMTEAESAAKVQEAAKDIVKAFPKIGAENRPEGFHMARKLLNDEFKVARITDLVHAQRIQFITKVAALVAKAS